MIGLYYHRSSTTLQGTTSLSGEKKWPEKKVRKQSGSSEKTEKIRDERQEQVKEWRSLSEESHEVQTNVYFFNSQQENTNTAE